jgi:hypothetical protein
VLEYQLQLGFCLLCKCPTKVGTLTPLAKARVTLKSSRPDGVVKQDAGGDTPTAAKEALYGKLSVLPLCLRVFVVKHFGQ